MYAPRLDRSPVRTSGGFGDPGSGHSTSAVDPERKFVTLRGARQSRSRIRSSALVVVFFALVTHRENRHVTGTVNLEQRNVSSAAERDHELAQ